MGASVTERPFSRREFLAWSAASLAFSQAACAADAIEPDSPNEGRLESRPIQATTALTPGTHALQLGGGNREGFIYLPPQYSLSEPMPVLLLLHGGGQAASEWNGAKPILDELGIAALVPDSRGGTWDRTRGSFGPDVDYIDRALRRFFLHVTPDPARTGIAGFSDGGSYSLSIGLKNGDLFSHILAFSPGFAGPIGVLHGKPLIYVTHGTNDTILPINSTSRAIVPQLRSVGYDVTYEEFEGGHQLTAELGERVFRWMLDGPTA